MYYTAKRVATSSLPPPSPPTSSSSSSSRRFVGQDHLSASVSRANLGYSSSPPEGRWKAGQGRRGGGGAAEVVVGGGGGGMT